MLNKILADLVVLVHLFWILFMLSGFILTLSGFFWKRFFAMRLFRLLHLFGIVYVVLLTILGKYCPLTVLENKLRGRYDLSLPYPGSFIAHYLERMVYPDVAPLIIIIPTILIGLFTIVIFILRPPFKQNHRMDGKICIYAGSGAVLAKDVEIALNKLNIPYEEINEHQIKEDKLNDCSVLIIPGGYTEECAKVLGGEGFRRIRKFIRSGGGYIGICAGDYLAAKIVEVRGHPEGLRIINIENRREVGIGIREITITCPNHPLNSGYQGKVRIWYQNGPMIKAGEDVEILAIYENNSAAIVCSHYGQGKVIIFSPHPEGSSEKKVDPQKLNTLKLLKNAILFGVKRRRR